MSKPDEITKKLASIQGVAIDKQHRDKIKDLLKKTIHIDWTDCYTQEHYAAELEFFIPNLQKRLEIEKLVPEILDGTPGVAMFGQGLARALAWIYVTIPDRPEWLSIDVIHDESVINDLFQKMQDHLEFFRENSRQRKGDSETGEMDDSGSSA